MHNLSRHINMAEKLRFLIDLYNINIYKTKYQPKNICFTNIFHTKKYPNIIKAPVITMIIRNYRGLCAKDYSSSSNIRFNVLPIRVTIGTTNALPIQKYLNFSGCPIIVETLNTFRFHRCNQICSVSNIFLILNFKFCQCNESIE